MPRRLIFCAATLLVSLLYRPVWAEVPTQPENGASKGAESAAAAPDLSEFKTVETALKATLSKPAATSNSGRTGFLGLNFAASEGKVVVAQVAHESPAAAAGIKAGDQVARIDDAAVTG